MISDMFHIHGLLWVLLCIISWKATGFGVTFVCILAGCSMMASKNKAIYCNKKKSFNLHVVHDKTFEETETKLLGQQLKT